MKKIYLVIAVISVMTTALVIYYAFFAPYDWKQTLTSFANEKEKAGPTELEGIIALGKDTVFFNLLPAVTFPLREYSADVIWFKNTSDTIWFERGMLNDQNVPNPDRNGKYMRGWEIYQTKTDSSFASRLDMVIRKGMVTYRTFPLAYQKKFEFACKHWHSLYKE